MPSDAGPETAARVSRRGAGTGVQESTGTPPRQDDDAGMPGEHDDVDRIVSAWRRERPDLDVTPMEVLSRVSRLSRRLDLARVSAFAEHGLEGWAFDVLSALRRTGAPYELSPGQLVQQTLVTSGTMTNRVDRLVRRGLVQRSPSPHDRRGVLVRLTPEGLRTVDAAMSDLLSREQVLLTELPLTDQKVLAAHLRRLLRPLEG